MLTIAGRCKSRLIPMFRREWQVELARNAGWGSLCVCAFSLVYVTYDKLTNVSPLECVPMSRRQVVPKSVRGAQVPCPLGDSSCGASAADIWRPGQMGLGLGPSSWLLRTLTAEDLVQPSFCFFLETKCLLHPEFGAKCMDEALRLGNIDCRLVQCCEINECLQFLR